MRGDPRGSALFFLGLAFAVAMTGCAIERPGISSSSLNPSPWFNFQLAPSKKDTPNYQRSIARNTTERATVKPAMAPVQKEVRWPEWSLPNLRREAQLLPRTDDVASKKMATDSAVVTDRSIDFN